MQTLYHPDDPRLRSAYNVYYVGINLGAVLAVFVCGTLGELFGWHWGFASAGVGMCLGLAIYLAGGRYLPRENDVVSPVHATTSQADESFMRRVGVLLAVIAIVVVFRGAYEQVGNTVALWADSAVDRSVGASWTIPSTWFQALNPLLVFTLTPLLLAIWRYRARAGQAYSPLRRMALGALIVGAAYVMLAVAAQLATSAGAPAHWLWLDRLLHRLHERRAAHSADRARVVRASRAQRACGDLDCAVVLRQFRGEPARGRTRLIVEPLRRGRISSH